MTVIRRPGSSTNIQFSLPNELREWVEQYAEDNGGMSMAAVIREAIMRMRYDEEGAP